MNRTLRSILIALFSAVSALCAVFACALTAGGGAQTAYAVDTNSFVTGGTSVRLIAPAGLRFTTYVNENYIAELNAAYGADGYKFGTLIIPAAILGGNALTAENDDAIDLERTVWGADEVDGYKTFHAVLTGIPESFYSAEITARAYVKPNGGDHIYAEPLTNNIAKVASYALNDGIENDLLISYVGGGIENVTVTENKALYVGESSSVALTTAPVGYKAVWSSSDESVITVDKNGVLTALAAGTATIAATVGERTDECAVTVKRITITFDNSSKTNITDWADETSGTKAALCDYGGKVSIPQIRFDVMSAAMQRDSTYSMAEGTGYWYYLNDAGNKVRFDASKAITRENFADVEDLCLTIYVNPVRQWAGPY